jgi:hypothetical protein
MSEPDGGSAPSSSMDAFFASIFGAASGVASGTNKPSTPQRPTTANGRAGSRLAVATRPESARPSTSTAISSSGYGGTGVALRQPKTKKERVEEALHTMVPTPQHLQRLQLHQSRSLVPPRVSEAQISDLPGPEGLSPSEQRAALTEALRKKMSLLEGERRAGKERTEWMSKQATMEIEELEMEGDKLRAEVEVKRKLAENERLAIETRKRNRLKNPDPLATAASMRARASTGHGLKPDSLFNLVGNVQPVAPASQPSAPSSAVAIVRRPSSARQLRGVSTAATIYDPATARAAFSTSVAADTSSTSVTPSPSVVRSAASDPFRALKFRRAYDLLKHAAEGKQKQHDALAKDLESMILKVKSAASADSEGRKRKSTTTYSDFNPFVLQLQQHLSRLDEVALETNDAATIRTGLQREATQLEHEQTFFTRTIQAAEAQLKAREIEYQQTVSVCAHALEAAEDAKSEQRKLYTRLSEQADVREEKLEEKEEERDDVRRDLEEEARKDREQRELQKQQQQQSIPSSSRAHKRSAHLPSLIVPHASSASTSSASDGDPSSSMAGVVQLERSTEEQNEEVMRTLSERSQAIVRACLKLEMEQLRKTRTGAVQPVDVNILFQIALERVGGVQKLRGVIEQKKERKEELQRELAEQTNELESARWRLEEVEVAVKDSAFLTQQSIDDREEEKQPYAGSAADESTKIATLTSECSSAQERYDLFTRKQTRLDSLQVIVRTFLKRLAEVLEQATRKHDAEDVEGASNSRRPSLQSASDASHHHARRSPAHSAGGSHSSRGRAGSTDAGSAPSPLNEKHELHLEPMLTTLVRIHSKLVEIAAAIPAQRFPEHLAGVAKELQASTPLFSQAASTGSSDATAPAAGTIAEEEEDEEEAFEVQHSPNEGTDG